MLNIMLVFSLVFLMANIMMTLCMLISKKSLMDREKMSAFECGFDQKSSSRLPFSLKFFLITIIFLIFDVEIALILPSISLIKTISLNSWIFINVIFILTLIVGVLHEWSQGMLEWSEFN